MEPIEPIDPRILDAARRQLGCIDEAVLRAAAVPTPEVLRRHLSGDWQRLQPRVFAAASQPTDHDVVATAALLSIGGDVALADASAAKVWAFPGLAEPVVPHVVVPGDRRYTHLDGVRVRRVVPARWAVRVRGGTPVTPLEATVRDVSVGLGHRQVRDLVCELLLERRTTLARLRAVCGRGLAGSAVLTAVVQELDPACHDYWERLMRRSLRRLGVVTEAQVRLRSADGSTCYLDLGIRRLRLGIEIDGFLSHMRRFAADRRRARRICFHLGWQLASVAVSELAHDAEAVAREIAAYARALEQR